MKNKQLISVYPEGSKVCFKYVIESMQTLRNGEQWPSEGEKIVMFDTKEPLVYAALKQIGWKPPKEWSK
jgi:hypothetical protein